MLPRNTATMSDVATLAKVSSSAVSKFLSGRMGNVSLTEQTQSRIRKAVKTLNYRPNVVAQSLRRGRSDMVVLLSSFNNPGLIASVASAVKDRKLESLVWTIRGDQELITDQIAAMLTSRQADGIILVGSCMGLSDYDCASLRRSGWPVVSLRRRFPQDTRIPSFDFDWLGVFRDVAANLKAHDHREILLLTEPIDRPAAKVKIAAAKKAFAEAGLALPNSHIRQRGEQEGRMVQTVSGAIDEGLRFTAIVYPDMHYEVVSSLLGRRMTLPEDVSLICLKDGAMHSHVHVPLTCCDFSSSQQMVREAVDALLALREGKTPKTPHGRIDYPVQFVLGTTLAPRKESS